MRQGPWPSTALSGPDQPQLISLGPLVPAPAAPPWFRSPPPPGTARSGTSKEAPWPDPALASPLGGIRYSGLRQPRGSRTGRGHEDPAGTSRPLCEAPFPANPRLRGVLLLPCEGRGRALCQEMPGAAPRRSAVLLGEVIQRSAKPTVRPSGRVLAGAQRELSAFGRPSPRRSATARATRGVAPPVEPDASRCSFAVRNGAAGTNSRALGGATVPSGQAFLTSGLFSAALQISSAAAAARQKGGAARPKQSKAREEPGRSPSRSPVGAPLARGGGQMLSGCPAAGSPEAPLAQLLSPPRVATPPCSWR